MIRARQIPSESPWYWTDDTAMALTIVHILHRHGQIRQDGLAQMFGATYQADPYRGYGYGMTVLLPRLAADPGTWNAHARALFGGQGSLGNGAAMRAAPLGAWFCSDPGAAREQANLAAGVTHAHPEGTSGAVAVALAAALAAASRGGPAPDPRSFLEDAADQVPGPSGTVSPRRPRSTLRRPPGRQPTCSATASGSGPATPCRSPCGARPIISMTSPERSGQPLKGSATSTRPARSPRGRCRPHRARRHPARLARASRTAPGLDPSPDIRLSRKPCRHLSREINRPLRRVSHSETCVPTDR
jgi:ADP-ribosylglycohydrolase